MFQISPCVHQSSFCCRVRESESTVGLNPGELPSVASWGPCERSNIIPLQSLCRLLSLEFHLQPCLSDFFPVAIGFSFLLLSHFIRYNKKCAMPLLISEWLSPQKPAHFKKSSKYLRGSD